MQYDTGYTESLQYLSPLNTNNIRILQQIPKWLISYTRIGAAMDYGLGQRSTLVRSAPRTSQQNEEES